MLIHSHKSTHDIEERLPENLSPEARDLLLRIAIAIRLNDPVMIREIPERIRILAETLVNVTSERDALALEARSIPVRDYIVFNERHLQMKNAFL